MRKPLLIVLLAALGWAAAAGTLPPNTAFDAPVSIASNGDLTLAQGLQMLGQTIGYTVLPKNLKDQKLTYDLATPRPFRTVWTLIANLYDLDFVVQNDLIIVGPQGSLSAFQPTAPKAAKPVERTYKVVNLDDIKNLLGQQFDKLQVTSVPDANTLIVTATPDVQAKVGTFISTFDKQISAGKAAKKVATSTQVYTVKSAPDTLQTLVVGAYPDAKVQQVGKSQALSITAPTSEMTDIRAYLQKIDAQQAALLPVRKAYRINNASAKTLSQAVTSMLKAKNINGSVTSDDRTNTLIVVAPPAGQDVVKATIKDLDVREKQVRIRVRVQEISTSEYKNLGLNLSGGVGTLTGSLADTGLKLALNPSAIINALTLNATLDLLEQQSLSRNINDATLLTLNNQAATLNSGGTIQLAVSDGNGGTQTQSLNFGTDLTVTPHVTSDGFITLDMQVSLSGFAGELSQLTGLQFTNKDVQSSVQIENGDVVVLGGLIQQSLSASENGVPVLKDLPVIGTFFKSKSRKIDKSELIIVLKATIE